MTQYKFDPNYDQNMLKITRLGHINRYIFVEQKIAENFDRPVHVLDAASGFGHGSFRLAQNELVAYVLGVEYDAETLELSRDRYKSPKLEFLRADLEQKLSFARPFDVVASIETIEHINNPAETLRNFHDCLTDDGLLIISTPNVKNTSDEGWKFSQRDSHIGLPKGTLHVKEYSREEMRALLDDAGFTQPQEFGLYVLFGYAIKFSKVKVDSHTDNPASGLSKRILENLPFVSEIFAKPYPFLVDSAKNIIYVSRKK